MAKVKISATIDPERLEAARRAAGSNRSVSEVLDLALDALVVRTLEERWLGAHAGTRGDLPGEVDVDLSEVPWEGGAP